LISLDFKGGLNPTGITEISGESASGKSQLCMQLLLQAQLPVDMGGLGGSSLYLSTEGTNSE
jgi:RecA/RadA recombinase